MILLLVDHEPGCDDIAASKKPSPSMMFAECVENKCPQSYTTNLPSHPLRQSSTVNSIGMRASVDPAKKSEGITSWHPLAPSSLGDDNNDDDDLFNSKAKFEQIDPWSCLV